MTSSSASSASLFSGLPTPTSSNNAPQPDSSSSFNDVLQQHGGDSSSASSSQNQKSGTTSNPDQHSDSSSTTSTPDDASTTTPTTPAPTPKGGGGGGKSAHGQKTPTATTPTNVTTGTLKSMLVQASVLASNTKMAATATPTDTATATDSATTDAPSPTIGSTELSALIAQVLAFATNIRPATPTATTSTKTNDTTDKTDDTAPKSDATPTAAVPDLSTLIAQATILAQGGQMSTTTAVTAKTTTANGKDVPVLGSSKTTAGTSTKEKKSVSTDTEGSFLQSGTNASTALSSLLTALGLSGTSATQTTSNQVLTTKSDDKKSTVDLLAKAGPSTAGTANVEKEPTMNADQNLTGILNVSGTTTALHENISDMQIKLSSNNNFENALKTVLHVASLNEVSQSRSATRVAIELQTPPGAIVNVYVTKQTDGWRAQLSTSDPTALSWVQDKMSSLKQTTDSGVEVKWLPPQIETTSTNTGSDANLGWDRGGQGQSDYQNPDERQQSSRQNEGDETELAAAGSSFMQTLTTSGRSS